MLHIATLLLVTMLSSSGTGAQTGEPPKSAHVFEFRRGQSVYVTAVHTIDHSAARRNSGVGPNPVIDNHLPAEFRIRQGFEERGVYKLVNKASEADFVFLVLIDESAAEGLALAPQAFADHQNPLDMSALRGGPFAVDCRTVEAPQSGTGQRSTGDPLPRRGGTPSQEHILINEV